MSEINITSTPQEIPGTSTVGSYTIYINAFEGPAANVKLTKLDRTKESEPVFLDSLGDPSGNHYVIQWLPDQRPKISCALPYTATIFVGNTPDERGGFYQDTVATIMPQSTGNLPRLTTFSRLATVGKALVLTGGSNYLNYDKDSDAAKFEAPFSIECWLCPMLVKGMTSFNIIQRGTSFQFGFSRLANTTLKEEGLCLRVISGSESLYTAQFDRIDVAGQWCLCHLTHDGTYARIYYQGEKITEKAMGITYLSSDFARIGAGTGVQQIKISQLATYNRCLSDSEIKARYNDGIGMKINPSATTALSVDGLGLGNGLTGMWSFNSSITEFARSTTTTISGSAVYDEGHLDYQDYEKKGVFTWCFAPYIGNELFFVCNLPHGWTPKTGIVAQVHWSTDQDGRTNNDGIPVDDGNVPVINTDGSSNNSADDPVQMVKWAIDYTVTGVNRTFNSAPTTIYGLPHRSGVPKKKTHIVTTFEGESGSPLATEKNKAIEINMAALQSGNLQMTYSSAIIGRLYRLKDDTYPYGAHFLSLNFHFILAAGTSTSPTDHDVT